MVRRMLKSKIHRVTVTEANIEYEGSVTIDEDLMNLADILENEKVAIWNIDAGTRFETYAIPGPRASGVLCINGAAARLVSPGDKVIIATFAEVDDNEARSWEPNVVLLGDGNEVKQQKSKETAFTRTA